MAKWDIDVATARSIISSTEDKHSSLPREKRTLGSAIDSASTACNSSLITAALDYVRRPALVGPASDAAEQAESATSNTAAAVEHYAQGDLDMAANASDKAAGAPDGEY
ncbi:DUF6507 family protein [Arthrobacter castelli]|uniref:DUF6507 family protein n=1 Tax=Arthrobacter castelli TaxID=271431 RepID=UPI000411B324|nr:DUF6507 family protein [Arthrobacter castelli]